MPKSGRDEFQRASLVGATGGLSIPKMGATAFGYEVARQFGLNLVETRPALVPLLFAEVELSRFGDLSGVSAEVVASIGGRRLSGKMPISRHGLRGPADLLSS